MATRYLDKVSSADTNKLRNLPDAAGIALDTADYNVKFNSNGTIKQIVPDNDTYAANNDRQIITEVFDVDGAALHAAILPAVTFPAAAIILRAILDVTTVSTGACTVDVGYTATTSTTTSDTLLDGIDVNGAIGIHDSMNAALDSGANALAQKAASGKWITIDEKTGDSTGLVAKLYVSYILI